ncbi:WD40 repeat-like protein [Neolentinus lepideus HHB14362 ss-1]|uniref:WD40 repeat-like protein n=1 Tax=Neolentinus lepideus HHB14362 ss-1 TaxID=1314782 RepID=A0A165VXR3_9AGAM|nr:WD40 repeat-like protein [Neolentinus lepideus HHB14362 ss-1]
MPTSQPEIIDVDNFDVSDIQLVGVFIPSKRLQPQKEESQSRKEQHQREQDRKEQRQKERRAKRKFRETHDITFIPDSDEETDRRQEETAQKKQKASTRPAAIRERVGGYYSGSSQTNRQDSQSETLGMTINRARPRLGEPSTQAIASSSRTTLPTQPTTHSISNRGLSLKSQASTLSAPPPKRKRPRPPVIEIEDSDDECITVVHNHATKKAKHESVYENMDVEDVHGVDFDQGQPEDDDDSWDNYHGGYDLIHGSSWKPSTVALVEPPDSMDDLSDDLRNLSIAEELVQPGYAQMHKRLSIPPLRLPEGGGYRPYPWADAFHPNDCYLSRYGSAFYAGMRRLQMTGRRTQALPLEVGMVSGFEYLPEIIPICKAPGSVNRILQRQGVAVVCSAVPGGGSEAGSGNLPASNLDGALTLWRDGQVHKIHSHRRKMDGNVYKWCTVNDIQWDVSDPTRSIFASSGYDGFVRLWDVDHVFHNAVLEDGELDDTFDGAIPLDLSFRPGHQELAVACNNGTLTVLRQPLNQQTDHLQIEFAQGHCTGAIIWGRGSTSSVIFASSESDGQSGVHMGWDLLKHASPQKFDAAKEESGDAMTIDPSGGILALFTVKGDAVHRLRLYDVGRKDYRNPTQTVDLEEFEVTFNESHEVTKAIYSPDGTYLAVARSDDSCHLYDSRYLTRGPLHKFKHKGESKASVAADTYGITEVQFVESLFGSRMYLVTGGTDGCVRLWDFFKSDDDRANGKIIAQSDYNVGAFSIGHPADGVQNLILGSCGGEVRMFKRGQGCD